jgi:hypothetical protein
MSEERSYGIERKNPECRTGVILGSYMTRPQSRGDIVSFIVVKRAGRVKCPGCGKEYEYDRADIREFPAGV